MTGLVAAGAAWLAYRAMRRRPPGGSAAWARVNHRGEPVTLLEGPAVAVGAVAAALTAGVLAELPEADTQGTHPLRAALAVALAGTGAAAFGTLDDLRGSARQRGLKGHLGALAHGEVTTGAVKLAGIGATGGVSGLLLRRPTAGTVDCVINAGLIAGGANLLNLFDLRPGRAIKVAVLSAGLISAGSLNAGSGAADAPLPAGTAVAAPVGAALALLPEDLGERAMLGDAGANALGAMLGAAAAGSLSRPARLAALAGVLALTGISEKVSFTKVIARTAPLNWLDMLGRRPPAAPAPAGPSSGREEREPEGGAGVRSADHEGATSPEPAAPAATSAGQERQEPRTTEGQRWVGPRGQAGL